MRLTKSCLLAGLLLGLVTSPAQAAGIINYKVDFTPSGDPALDALLKQTSSLVALQKKLPPAPFALVGRARADEQQFAIVLHSLGYDAGSVAITIDGLKPDDPALLDHLSLMPKDQTAILRVTAHQGKMFTLGVVATPGLPPGFAPPPMVRPGQRALAAPVLEATPALLRALHNAGYAFATVSPPRAVARPATHRLDVTYTIAAGPRVKIGAIGFVGLQRTDPAFLRAHIALHPGQQFSDTAIAQARDSLLSLGIFSSVTAAPGPETKDSAVPIIFRVTPQKRHAVSLSFNYSTDQGFTVGTSWLDRNVFRHAETLTFTVAANGLGGTGTTSPGYDIKGVFAKPDYLSHGQTLTLGVEGLQQSLTAYNRTALLANATLSRPLTAHISLAYGPGFVDETVRQQGTSRNYVLLQLPVTMDYDTADSVLEPTRGINASLTLTPTEPVIGAARPFFIIQAQASTYLRVEADARGIIALHGDIASIQGAAQFAVPADQRFYAGGSGTVRGYTYQTIGPLFPDHIPEGGLALDAGSIEFRQRIGKSFGIVPFIDAGQVSAHSAPFQGTLRIGAGIGARYYTGIGPIRADIAFPLSRIAGNAGFALYIGLGESF